MFHKGKACKGDWLGWLNVGYYGGSKGRVEVLFYLLCFYSCVGVKNVLIESIVLFYTVFPSIKLLI